MHPAILFKSLPCHRKMAPSLIACTGASRRVKRKWSSIEILFWISDFEYINIKHVGREWTLFEYRGRRVFNALREHSLGHTHFVANNDLAGSLDDVMSDTARRGVRSREDSDRGRDLERHARNPARRVRSRR